MRLHPPHNLLLLIQQHKNSTLIDMKKFVIFMSLAFDAANASYAYSTSCSDGEGTIRLGFAQNSTGEFIVTQLFKDGGRRELDLFYHGDDHPDFDLTEETVLRRSRGQECDGINEHAYGAWVSVETLKLQKDKNPSLPESLLGFTDIGDAFVANLICSHSTTYVCPGFEF